MSRSSVAVDSVSPIECRKEVKDDETRVLPISQRLAGVLEMAKIDPAGKEYEPDDYVFGECERRVQSTKRAWMNACTRAGIDDLHFHDLRHEAGSRLLEAGWPIHHVKEMLGTQTCRRRARI